MQLAVEISLQHQWTITAIAVPVRSVVVIKVKKITEIANIGTALVVSIHNSK